MMLAIEPILYAGAIGLIAIGVAGMALSRHGFRIVLALALAEAGANLLLVLGGFREGGVAPILVGGGNTASMVDPVPQAMVLTAIVIGVGVQALAIALLIQVKEHLGPIDRQGLRDAMEADIDRHAGLPLPESLDRPLSREGER